MPGWGSAVWGDSAWGGSASTGLVFLNAVAVRENVIRLEFNTAVYFSSLLEPADASDATHYTAAPVSGSYGNDGEPARAVTIVEVKLATVDDGIDITEEGRFVDLYLDRPMSPWPAVYTLTASDIFSEDLSNTLASATTLSFYAVYRMLQQPTVDTGTPSRDLANPQTLSGAFASGIPVPDATGVLGTYSADSTGDYAFDEGTSNLRKRVIRRGITKKNGFAHLPGYGVGLPYYGKKLARSSTLAQASADYEAQVLQEPDVSTARISAAADPDVPSLVRFKILVRPKQGRPFKVEMAISTLETP